MTTNAYGKGYQVGANGGVAAPKQTTHQQQNLADKGFRDGKTANGN